MEIFLPYLSKYFILPPWNYFPPYENISFLMKIFQTSTTWQSLRMEIFLPYKYFLPPDENISDQCHVVAPPVVEVPHPPPLPPPHHQYPGALLHIVFYLRL